MRWTISDADLKLYKQMWAAADAAKAGKVSAAGSMLSRSGLPSPTLMEIWKLSDLDGDNFLVFHEYAVACHIITRHLQLKLPIPSALPPALVASAKALQTPSAAAATAAPVSAPPAPSLPTLCCSSSHRGST